jgi:hypothetical protein
VIELLLAAGRGGRRAVAKENVAGLGVRGRVGLGGIADLEQAAEADVCGRSASRLVAPFVN